MMYYDYSFFSPFHFLFAMIGWFIVVCIIVFAIRRLVGRGHTHHRWYNDSAIDALRERYAKGEISKEEFEEKKKVLNT